MFTSSDTGNQETLAEVICTEAHNLIFRKAVSSGDRFRQYVYSSLPRDYTFNPAIDAEIERLMSQGLSAAQIAKAIYEAHA